MLDLQITPTKFMFLVCHQFAVFALKEQRLQFIQIFSLKFNLIQTNPLEILIFLCLEFYRDFNK